MEHGVDLGVGGKLKFERHWSHLIDDLVGAVVTFGKF